MERKRNDWSIRLAEELKHAKSAHFLTFTYSPELLPYSEDSGAPTLVKSDLQDFLKRLRISLSRGIQTDNFQGKSVKTPKIAVKLIYFAQGEYGSQKNRPHYHMILFNMPRSIDFLIERCWQKGFVHYGDCNAATIHYTTKYMITKYDSAFDGVQKPFALMSKGIGKSYADRNGEYHRTNQVPTLTQLGGAKYPLPRYLKDKIFSDVEKLQMTARNVTYTERRQMSQDSKLLSTLKDESELIAVKHERTKAYLSAREKFLNKNQKL